MFWIAKAKENTSRLQPRAMPIGCMNRPKVARTPMASRSAPTAHARIRFGDRRQVVVFMAGILLADPIRPVARRLIGSAAALRS
ncbi:MAG: hypothetical protein AMXMBFR52_12190 [Burkholderiales bacterium]